MNSKRIAALASRLARTAVFAPLDAAERGAIARAGARKSLRQGRVLFRRGQEADALVLVLSGRLDITRYTERGERVIVRSLGADALIGLSTVAGARHSADVVAGEPSQIFLIRGGDLRGLIARSPDLALRAMVHLAGLLSELTDEVQELRIYDLQERIQRRLVRIGRGRRELALTHAELAAQVGASRANVSRALKALEAKGVLQRHRGRIELL